MKVYQIWLFSLFFWSPKPLWPWWRLIKIIIIIIIFIIMFPMTFIEIIVVFIKSGATFFMWSAKMTPTGGKLTGWSSSWSSWSPSRSPSWWSTTGTGSGRKHSPVWSQASPYSSIGLPCNARRENRSSWSIGHHNDHHQRRHDLDYHHHQHHNHHQQHQHAISIFTIINSINMVIIKCIWIMIMSMLMRIIWWTKGGTGAPAKSSEKSKHRIVAVRSQDQQEEKVFFLLWC